MTFSELMGSNAITNQVNYPREVTWVDLTTKSPVTGMLYEVNARVFQFLGRALQLYGGYIERIVERPMSVVAPDRGLLRVGSRTKKRGIRVAGEHEDSPSKTKRSE